MIKGSRTFAKNLANTQLDVSAAAKQSEKLKPQLPDSWLRVETQESPRNASTILCPTEALNP